MKLLHIDASITGVNSVSRQLSAAIVDRLRDTNPAIEEVIYHDLGAEPLDHLSEVHLAAAQGQLPKSPAKRLDLVLGEMALEDFLAAEIIVIGAPMYNFSIPSQLKAWIDRVCVAGKTFRYTDKGPVGLAGNKRVIIASSRGGFYGPDTPRAFLDHHETYLSGIFGFLGISDITFIRAEGVSVGPDQRNAAIEAATSEISKLAA
jgi:FMN-dependent NADH-azoreductase